MKGFSPCSYAILMGMLLLSACGFISEAQVSTKAPTCTETFAAGTSADSAQAARWNLCQLIEMARLDDLQWPDFEEYREQVRQFYFPSNYALAWVSANQPTLQARAMINLLRQAEREGLDPDDYDGPRWPERLDHLASAGDTLASENMVRFDLALTVSAMRYVSDLHNGRVSPALFHFGLETKRLDVVGLLRDRLLPAADTESAIEEVEPPFAGYRRTKQVFEHYLTLANEGEGAPIPIPSFPLKSGDTYLGITQLAERLRRFGDLAQNPALPSEPNIYRGAPVAAVKHFQQRHGLQPDGRVTRETYDQLTTPFSRRAAQLQLTLERFRWLPTKLDAPLIVVNIPEFRLRAYEDHRVTLNMKAIVGEAFDHQTPVFADRMGAVVFRPYWNVPESIQKTELVAELRKHPHYLLRHQMEVVNGRGEVITADLVNAKTLRQLETGHLMLRQQPGPANALGLVKFVFPNQYSIYMHGTPETGLFARSRRDLSHGCIRLENPAALAAWVLRDDPAWTPERIKAAMRGNDSIEVKLPHSIPVLILYGTALVEEDGQVRFFSDIYGLDATLQVALDHRHEKSH